MPRTFRLAPKKGKDKLFIPPSKRNKEDSYTPEYKRARGIRNSSRWKSIRDHMVRRFPVCELCCEEATDEVHHIDPLVESPERGFDKTNLLCVCERCHQTIHVREKLGESVRPDLFRIVEEREL